jgi:hypothetical protein
MFNERTVRRIGAAILAVLSVAALSCSPVALAAGRHHTHRVLKHRHHHRRHHRHRRHPAPKPHPRPVPPRPVPQPPGVSPGPAPNPAPAPTPAPTPVTAHHCDSDSGTPSGCAADLQLVSITPSETTAKVGDEVSFTITTLNAGPDTGEVWVDASPATTIDCPDGSTGESCVELAGVLGAGQSRTGGADGVADVDRLVQ